MPLFFGWKISNPKNLAASVERNQNKVSGQGYIILKDARIFLIRKNHAF